MGKQADLDPQVREIMAEMDRLFKQRHAVRCPLDVRLHEIQRRIDGKFKELSKLKT